MTGYSAHILVTEKIADAGILALQSRGYKVTELLDATPEQLKEAIATVDALIVRSATQVSADLLDAAKQLKVIGRAGVTVDNIDIEAANERDIVVCNAPASNIISAAEYTMALMLAAARNICPANSLVHSRSWQRHRFLGVELYGKTLAIFGLGRVGSLVAERARAFGMNVIAYDPYCSPERAAALDVTLIDSFEEVLPQADFITVHLPLTQETYGMFGSDQFAAMKNGVVLVNPARGGIFQIDALADFLAAGKIAAVGIDVYEEEPCTSSPLHEFENAVLTPHISAVTKEAQARAASEIAEYVWAALEGSIVPTAITTQGMAADVIDEVHAYMRAAKTAGRLLAGLNGVPRHANIQLEGTISDADPSPIVAGVVEGLLSYKQVGSVSIENARALAGRHGVDISTTSSQDAQGFESAIRIKADGAEIAFTLYGLDQQARIISFNGYRIDIAPAAHSLVFEYIDSPGRIGTIGTILGEENINITTMQIGVKPEEKCALVYINVESPVSAEVMEKLENAMDYKHIWQLSL